VALFPAPSVTVLFSSGMDICRLHFFFQPSSVVEVSPRCS
jgi:hypothetical protein